MGTTVKEICVALKHSGSEFVAKNFAASIACALACLVTSTVLIAAAPVHYTANLHIAPSASAIPIAWILDTDQIRSSIVKDLNLTSHYGLTDTLAARKLRQATTVNRSFGNAMDVQVSDKSAAMAAKIAAAYSEGIHRMTIDFKLSNSAAYLYEVQLRKKQALKFLKASETALADAKLEKAINQIPSGWLESINASGPILAANALQSKGPYQTNGPSTFVLESQRLAVLESIYSERNEQKKAATLNDDLPDAIRAVQEFAFWKALVAGMSEREESLLQDIRRDASNAPVEVPTVTSQVYPVIPWIAAILALLGLPLLALCISNIFDGRRREVV